MSDIIMPPTTTPQTVSGSPGFPDNKKQRASHGDHGRTVRRVNALGGEVSQLLEVGIPRHQYSRRDARRALAAFASHSGVRYHESTRFE
jgi:hypothetical protein